MSCPKLTVLTTLVWIAVIGVSGTNAQSIYLGGLNVIRRANLDGSNLETLLTASDLGGVQEIALDVAGGKMYWTVRGPDTRIQRANLDGSELEVLVSSGLSDLHGIALDVDAGKMYWTDMGSEKIQRADLDGSNVEDTHHDRLGDPVRPCPRPPCRQDVLDQFSRDPPSEPGRNRCGGRLRTGTRVLSDRDRVGQSSGKDVLDGQRRHR